MRSPLDVFINRTSLALNARYLPPMAQPAGVIEGILQRPRPAPSYTPDEMAKLRKAFADAQARSNVVTPPTMATSTNYVLPPVQRMGVGAFVGEDVMRCVGASPEIPVELQPLVDYIAKIRKAYFDSFNAPKPTGKKAKDNRAANTQALKEKLDNLEKDLADRLSKEADKAEFIYAQQAALTKIKTLNANSAALGLNSTTTSTTDPTVASGTAPVGTPASTPAFTPSSFAAMTTSAKATQPSTNWTLWLAGGAVLLGVGFFLIKRKR
jgi:hypothetical protein